MAGCGVLTGVWVARAVLAMTGDRVTAVVGVAAMWDALVYVPAVGALVW